MKTEREWVSQGIFLRWRTKLISGVSPSKPPFVPACEPQLFSPSLVNAGLMWFSSSETWYLVSEHYEYINFSCFIKHRITQKVAFKESMYRHHDFLKLYFVVTHAVKWHCYNISGWLSEEFGEHLVWSEDATLALNNGRPFQLTPRLLLSIPMPREPAVWAINTLRNGNLSPPPLWLCLSHFVASGGHREFLLSCSHFVNSDDVWDFRKEDSFFGKHAGYYLI